MTSIDLSKIEFFLKKVINKINNSATLINIFFIKKNQKIGVLILLLVSLLSQEEILSNISHHKNEIEKNNIKWRRIKLEEKNNKDIIWQKIENNTDNKLLNKQIIKYENLTKNYNKGISSLNRSIVFDNSIVGPDISWLVPPGFRWNTKYKFDTSVRGHSGRFEKGRNGKSFWGWNSGDAVGQFYYQFINNQRTSFGLNYGIRSLYSGDFAVGGGSAFGEGQSLGFRIDRRISPTEGISFGAEQILHFDGLTDTGRDIYLTFSKALWSDNETYQFPLDIYTFGFATGRMAEGNLKFLCSDLLGGSGTELLHKRRLCWSPVFTISRVFNKKISTFFEYNSKWFILGSSIIPFNEVPLRGTFAVQLSDHIDNYKLNRFDEMKWVFRLSLGF